MIPYLRGHLWPSKCRPVLLRGISEPAKDWCCCCRSVWLSPPFCSPLQKDQKIQIFLFLTFTIMWPNCEWFPLPLHSCVVGDATKLPIPFQKSSFRGNFQNHSNQRTNFTALGFMNIHSAGHGKSWWCEWSWEFLCVISIVHWYNFCLSPCSLLFTMLISNTSPDK